MNIFWTFFVCAATCLLSDVRCASFNQGQQVKTNFSDETTARGLYSALVLFRNGTARKDVANACKGIQVKYKSYTGLSTYYIITPADCLDFAAEKGQQYRLTILSEKEEWFSNIYWRKEVDHRQYQKHPAFNPKTKEHNIAVFIPGHQKPHEELVTLPDHYDVFEGKDLEITSWTDAFGDGKGLKLRIEPNCHFDDDCGTCTITHFKIAIGDSLTYKDAQDKRILAGIATLLHPGAHYVGLPIEFTSIQPYINWIVDAAKGIYGS